MADSVDKQAIHGVLDTLRELRGVHLWGYRIEWLEKYIGERTGALELDSCAAYSAYVSQNDSECDALLNAMLISSSSFFREGLTFSILAEAILPCLLDENHLGGRELRVWSAGCSAGEEIYSVAILLKDLMELSGKQFRYFLLGTDINENALEQAKQGAYSRESLRYVPLRIVESYFVERENFFELIPSVRAMVHFCKDDVLNEEHIAPVESIFGSFDLILCRNLLMYYDIKRQNIIAEKLNNCLNRNGYLIVGDSESFAGSNLSRFISVMGRQFILQKT